MDVMSPAEQEALRAKRAKEAREAEQFDQDPGGGDAICISCE